MPRIDPLKLLTCLGVLLAPNGGIRSAQEVKRLAGLMAKFSKKLVSKCIYIQILKCTETELLGQFMAAGGWSLTHMWLADGIQSKNWPLIQELLELLLCCPVDVERLKSNTAPKLVKALSKDSTHEGVRVLATKLVEQWLKIAKNDIRSIEQQQTMLSPASGTLETNNNDSFGMNNVDSSDVTEVKKDTSVIEDTDDEEANGEENDDNISDDNNDKPDAEVIIDNVDDIQNAKQVFNKVIASDTFKKKVIKAGIAESNAGGSDSDSSNKKETLVFKITVKNGKQIVAKVESPHKTKDLIVAEEELKLDDVDGKSSPNESSKKESRKSEDKKDKLKDKEKSKDKEKEKEKEKDTEKEKVKEKDKDKHKEKDKKSSHHNSSSSDKSKSSHKSSSSSSSSSRHKSSSSSSSSKSSSKDKDSDKHRSKDKERDKDKDKERSSSKHSSSSKSSSSKSSSSSSSSKDKDKEKDKEKSHHHHHHKEKPEKDLSKVMPIDKLVKKKDENSDSPKHSSKKASISIEVRNSDHRPKTVKTVNSQFRNHGLGEEAPPPPSRKTLKKPSSSSTSTTSAPPPLSPSLSSSSLGTTIGSTATGTIAHKRSSPLHSSKDGPPEKKLKEITDKPGGVKLISPPKRQHSLVESDMFMDAISAQLPKKVVKRKRRISSGDTKSDTPTTPTTPTLPPVTTNGIKNSTTENKISPPASPTTPTVPSAALSPTIPKAAPLKFYQDTLEENIEETEKKDEEVTKTEDDIKPDDIKVESATTIKDEHDDDEANDDYDEDIIRNPKKLKTEVKRTSSLDDKDSLIDAVGEDVMKKIEEKTDVIATDEIIKKPPGPGCGPDGPPGVLVIHRKKGPKKQLKWKAAEELVETRYFELDVTERVNVYRTFTEAKQLERCDEGKQFLLARNVPHDDIMVEQTPWTKLIEIDNVPPHPCGSNSEERKVQKLREESVLTVLYFHRSAIPDSAAEPDPEVHYSAEPKVIPLDDITGNPDAVNDFTNMPWPEPKVPSLPSVFNPSMFPQAGGPPGMFPGSTFGPPANWNMPPGFMPNMPNTNLPMPGFNPMNPAMNMPPQLMPSGPMSMPNFGGPMHPGLHPQQQPQQQPQPLFMPNNHQRDDQSHQQNRGQQQNGGWFRGDRGDRSPGDRSPPNRDNRDIRNYNDNNDRDNYRDNRDRRDRDGDRFNNRNRNNNYRNNNNNNWAHNNRGGGGGGGRGGPPPCRQFESKGFCRNGNSCKYAHIR
uniref:Putative serine/threonine-protein phosphatase 1 regulatory subunit 10-like isoform x1 n=1 Tax=Corethrella appendiculata TaxID=1370023 RepID=U5ETU3_9DIPT